MIITDKTFMYYSDIFHLSTFLYQIVLRHRLEYAVKCWKTNSAKPQFIKVRKIHPDIFWRKMNYNTSTQNNIFYIAEI